MSVSEREREREREREQDLGEEQRKKKRREKRNNDTNGTHGRDFVHGQFSCFGDFFTCFAVTDIPPK